MTINKISDTGEQDHSTIGKNADYYRKQLVSELTQEDFENNDKARVRIFNKERALKDRNLFRPDLKGKD